MRNIKRILGFLGFMLLLTCSYSQGGIWTWMNGDKFFDSPGYYGIQGITEANNNPPGKYQAAHWTDKDGNFWVFGGRSVGALTKNDLWKFNPYTNLWTWMHGEKEANGVANYGIKGVPSPTNVPEASGYGALAWYDGDNGLYLYGGSTLGNSKGTNLWKFDIDLNQWIWIDGFGEVERQIDYGELGVSSQTSNPGRRSECESTWFWNDGLWFFGGQSSDSLGNPQLFSDVWLFDLSLGQWSWVKNPKGYSEDGIIGEIGHHDALNYPSGRNTYSRWVKDNYFYIYSGRTGNIFSDIRRADMWEYDMLGNTWAWMDGEQYLPEPVVDARCMSDSTTNPGAEFEHQCTQTHFDSRDYFWMLNGMRYNYYDETTQELWAYEPCSRLWYLVWGNPVNPIIPNFGEEGVADLDNVPPPRQGACMWADTLGAIWVFGGYVNESPNMGSDMWKFEPDYSCFSLDSINCCELAVDLRIGHVSSDSVDNGTISINVLDGEGDLEYSIDGGNTWIGDNFFQDLPPGDYNVVVRDSLGCTFETLVTILDFTTSTLGLENELSIEIFPNPASDILYYAIGSRDADRVEVYCMNGEEIECRKAERRLEINALPSGIYLLCVMSEGRNGVVKFEKI